MPLVSGGAGSSGSQAGNIPLVRGEAGSSTTKIPVANASSSAGRMPRVTGSRPRKLLCKEMEPGFETFEIQNGGTWQRWMIVSDANIHFVMNLASFRDLFMCNMLP